MASAIASTLGCSRFLAASIQGFAAVIDQVFGSRLTSARRTRLLANDLDAMGVLCQDRKSNADVPASMTMLDAPHAGR